MVSISARDWNGLRALNLGFHPEAELGGEKAFPPTNKRLSVAHCIPVKESFVFLKRIMLFRSVNSPVSDCRVPRLLLGQLSPGPGLFRKGVCAVLCAFPGFYALNAGGSAETNAEIAQRRVLSHPKDSVAWEQLVRARIGMKDLDRAERAVQMWRTACGGRKDVVPLIDLLEAVLCSERGRPGDAVMFARRSVSGGIASPEAWNLIAYACAAQEKWEEAIDAISAVISIERSQKKAAILAKHLATRAEWRLRLRDWRNATDDILEANTNDPSEVTVLRLHPRLESSPNWLPELEALDRMVGAAGEDAVRMDLLLKRCVWFLSHAWNAQAYEDAKSASLLGPGLIRVRFWRGFCARLNGQFKDARPVMESGAGYREWILESDQLRTLEGIDALNDTEKQAEELLKLKQPLMALEVVGPRDGSIAKVAALRALNDPVRARRAAARAFEMHPDSPEALLLWAEAEFEGGNFEEAQRQIRRILEMDRGSARERALALEDRIRAGSGRR